MYDARTTNGTWTKDAEVYVSAPQDAKGSLGIMAVLEIRPRNVAFRIGWRSREKPAEFYSEQATTHEHKLAMRVGREDVIFVARSCDGRTQLLIELIELVAEDDPRYAELPWY